MKVGSSCGGRPVLRAKKWARRAHASRRCRPGGVVYVVEVSTRAVLRAAGGAVDMDASPRGPVREDSRGKRVSRGPSGVPDERVVRARGGARGRGLPGRDPAHRGRPLDAASRSRSLTVAKQLDQRRFAPQLRPADPRALCAADGLRAPRAAAAARRWPRSPRSASSRSSSCSRSTCPTSTRPECIGQRFTDAAAAPKTGFYLETLGAFLLLIAGSAGLFLSSPAPPSPPAPRAAAAARTREPPPRPTPSRRRRRRR